MLFYSFSINNWWLSRGWRERERRCTQKIIDLFLKIVWIVWKFNCSYVIIMLEQSRIWDLNFYEKICKNLEKKLLKSSYHRHFISLMYLHHVICNLSRKKRKLSDYWNFYASIQHAQSSTKYYVLKITSKFTFRIGILRIICAINIYSIIILLTWYLYDTI